jgi:hypothetical protein
MCGATIKIIIRRGKTPRMLVDGESAGKIPLDGKDHGVEITI